MIEIFDRSKHRPVPCGLVSTLKTLEIGESIIVSATKKSSIHPAAKRAGVRMTLRSLGDGTVCAWRVPTAKAVPIPAQTTEARASQPQPQSQPSAAVTTRSIFDDGLDIFGQPLKKEKPPVVTKPAIPTRPKGTGYYQPDQWSARVWYDDLDKAPATTETTVFS